MLTQGIAEHGHLPLVGGHAAAGYGAIPRVDERPEALLADVPERTQTALAALAALRSHARTETHLCRHDPAVLPPAEPPR
jgi:hypothetical protein